MSTEELREQAAETALQLVKEERISQRANWDASDLSWTHEDWIALITAYAGRGSTIAKRNFEERLNREETPNKHDMFVDAMKKVSAIALAAIESVEVNRKIESRDY